MKSKRPGQDLATWKNAVLPNSRPVQLPFDLDQCLIAAQEGDLKLKLWFDTIQRRTPTPLHLSCTEAFFWLSLFFFKNEPDKKGMKCLSKSQFEQFRSSIPERVAHLQSVGIAAVASEVFRIEKDEFLSSLFLFLRAYEPLELIAHLTFEINSCNGKAPFDAEPWFLNYRIYYLMREFRRWIVPYLTEKEMDSLRDLLRPQLVHHHPPTEQDVSSYIVAAFLGMPAEIMKFLSCFPDGYFADIKQYDYIPLLVCSLSPGEEIVHQMRRLNLSIYGSLSPSRELDEREEDFVKAWIANTEESGIELLFQPFKYVTKKVVAKQLFGLCTLIDSPIMVPYMNDLLEHTAVAQLARNWLQSHGQPGGVSNETLPTEELGFLNFLRRLEREFDKARISKAMIMLKSQRFHLYSEVSDDAAFSIIRSQTDPDLVYACCLNFEGAFSCCTQNLRACGGLRGALCKHILVMVIALTRAERLTPAKSAQWIVSSLSKKPHLDKPAMSEILIRFKKLEAGEIDWRPTETIPEDFYTF